jgi:hypothetical protein
MAQDTAPHPVLPAAAGPGRALQELEGPPVELRNRNAIELDPFEAANIDGSHGFSGLVARLGVGVNTADGAEVVFDGVLVERVGAGVFVGGEQTKVFPGDEPQERTLALAD